MADPVSDATQPILMEVRGLMLDPASHNPIVVLRDPDSETFLPIWIGLFEASAIQAAMQGTQSPRPRTHDLLVDFVACLGATVEKVVIEDLRDQTFYAIIHLLSPAGPVEVDARPSDAIALSLRTETPIFVQPLVLEKARVDESVTEAERARRILEEMEPEELGEYKM